MLIQEKSYTLLLGAEGELGRALAREVARRKCNLILVSTTTIDLQRFAIGLQLKEEVHVETLKLDLADPEAVRLFAERMGREYDIRALINNIAGDWSAAHKKYISEIAREDFISRFRGAAQLTMGLLPKLRKLSAGYIQHIIPFPLKKDRFSPEMQLAISKMYSYTRELDEALKDTVIHVSKVYPAPVKKVLPELEVLDGLSDEISALAPRVTAIKAINGMLRGDRLVIPGFRNSILYFLNRQAKAWLRTPQETLGSTIQASV